MMDKEKEANVDGDDRAPLLSYPPKSSSTENAINAGGELGKAGGGSRFCSRAIVRVWLLY